MSKFKLTIVGMAAGLWFSSGVLCASADVVVSNKPTRNMDCQAGVCTATAKKAVLNVGDLANMLASGDTTIKSDTAKNIDIDQPLSWTAASRLTLDAKRTITVNRPVSASQGSATIDYNISGGDLQFFGKGKIDLLSPSSSLVINGATYTLAYDVASLAAAIAKDTAGNFALATDYDAANESYDDSPIPVFNGNFEGLGHRISRLNISERFRNPEVGFFGEVGGVVRDIALPEIRLSVDKAIDGGAIAGLNGGLIVHVWASGRVRAKERTLDVGGLVGWNQGTVTKSGANINGEVAGGLVGVNLSSIDQSFAAGEVRKFGGGLVGNLTQGTINNSYASADAVAGGGGLIGEGNISVASSYSTGQVAQTSGSGGFVGEADSNAAQNDYWDIDTSGHTNGCGSGDCSGITGLSDAQLKSGLPAGFDPKIWAQNPGINGGYPYLRNNPPPQ